MTVETDFRALLAGHAGTVALVGSRIAQDAVDEGAAYPLVVFGVVHNYELGLDNTVLGDQCQITVECWAETGLAAAALADQVAAAVATAPASAGAVVLARTPTNDPELGLDGVSLTVEWWV